MNDGDFIQMEHEEKSNVPDWDGDPSTWNEFVVSTKWYVQEMNGEDRPLAVASIARKLLQSSNQSVKRLVQKLDPDQLTSGESVSTFLTYLAKSPLSRMSVPETGKKMQVPDRRLQRRRGEAVGQYRVKEEESTEAEALAE